MEKLNLHLNCQNRSGRYRGPVTHRNIHRERSIHHHQPHPSKLRCRLKISNNLSGVFSCVTMASMVVSWKSFSTLDPGSELIGVIGEIRPFRYRTIPQIMQSTLRIEAQLADSDGLVGYISRAEYFRRRFWVVSVWDEAESLRNIVETPPMRESRRLSSRRWRRVDSSPST